MPIALSVLCHANTLMVMRNPHTVAHEAHLPIEAELDVHAKNLKMKVLFEEVQYSLYKGPAITKLLTMQPMVTCLDRTRSFTCHANPTTFLCSTVTTETVSYFQNSMDVVR